LNVENFRDYCRNKRGTTEEFPFDENTLVFKVVGKMFALADVNEFTSINLKCDPQESLDLQERFPAVTPGYHMNKKHWITVLMDGSLSDGLLFTWIDKSYNLVVEGLTKKDKATLESM
jgi:predicted DNA-binding protein (MmcQ/YjbR family)